jgi:hypothetical protein
MQPRPEIQVQVTVFVKKNRISFGNEEMKGDQGLRRLRVERELTIRVCLSEGQELVLGLVARGYSTDSIIVSPSVFEYASALLNRASAK